MKLKYKIKKILRKAREAVPYYDKEATYQHETVMTYRRGKEYGFIWGAAPLPKDATVTEVITDATVQVLFNSKTGKTSIAWRRN